MSDREQAKPGLSRRAMLAGLGGAAGAVAAGGLVLPDAAAAAVSGDQNAGLVPLPSGPASALGLAAATVTKTRNLNVLSWVAVNNAAYTYVGPGGMRPSTTDFWNCPLDLEPGSTIVSVSLYINPGGSARAFQLTRYDGAALTFATVKTGTTTAGSAVETATIADIDHLVLGAPWSYRVDDLSLSSTAVLYGGTVTYTEPAASGFVPISPVRVYDSRWKPAPASLTVGTVASGASRVVSVADGRVLTSGAVATADVVPSGATAVTYNLTAVPAGTAAGFLAITPGDATTFAASAVNWAGGAAIANGGVVTLDATRQVKVWAGGGGTADVIVDITGYYR